MSCFIDHFSISCSIAVCNDALQRCCSCTVYCHRHGEFDDAGAQVKEFCGFGTREDCSRSNANSSCDKLHFKKIINCHTDGTSTHSIRRLTHLLSVSFVFAEFKDLLFDLKHSFESGFATCCCDLEWVICILIHGRDQHDQPIVFDAVHVMLSSMCDDLLTGLCVKRQLTNIGHELTLD